MALSAGTRLGPYEIGAAIGAGGMGEVYRARDTRLGRDVALKILPEAFAADPERIARFRREAQVLASLNHPNIAQIHGFEDGDGVHALVMEFVDGVTLSDRIAPRGRAREALASSDAIAIAAQIALALEAAHEAGIIHRDLKPANIAIKDDGTVKVLDFGLAKALTGHARDADDIANSPTVTSPAAMTGTGMILGTVAYMSPEQARGKPVDKRADIWAFGVVLWEMLTGQPLFAGETLSETIAAVIKDAPRLDRLPAGTPPAVRRLVARCLERDPKLRLRDIGEARIVLASADVVEPAAADTSTPSAPGWRRAAALVMSGVALAAVTGAIVWRARPEADLPVRRFELPAEMATAPFSLAPDGTQVAYVQDGRLRVRAFDDPGLDARDLGPMPRPIATLAWSPDSRTVALAAGNRLLSVPAGGGPPFEIATLPATGRALDVAWQDDGALAFAVWRDSLYRVPASGGSPQVFVPIDQASEIDFHTVSAVPGNRVVVTTHLRKPEASYNVELIDSSGRRTVLLADARVSAAEYASPGYLLLSRFGANAGIWAVPFAERPIDLSAAVLVQPGEFQPFSASRDGTLLFLAQSFASRSELVWVDRRGAVSTIPGSALVMPEPGLAIAPNGGRVLLHTTQGSDSATVLRDLASGADLQLRLAPGASQGLASRPGWFPAGDRAVIATGVVEAARIVALQTDGSGAARDLVAGRFARVSRDGRHLVYIEDDRGRGRVRYAAFQPDGSVGPPQPLFAGAEEPNVTWLDLSPDGGVLAYAAIQENQQSNVFLTTLPDARGRWTVTTDGGVRPRFSRDGRELFYLGPSRAPEPGPAGLDTVARRGQMNVVSVTLSPAVTLGVRSPLFEEERGELSGVSLADFDIAPDGRFLMTRRVAASAATPRLVFVQNWRAALR